MDLNTVYIHYIHKYTYEYMDFIGFNSPRGDLGIRGGVLSPVDLPLMYGDWVWCGGTLWRQLHVDGI